MLVRCWRASNQPANYGELLVRYHLLRRRSERPQRRRAAEKRNELAAFHSITSSARANSVGGISRPNTFAVVRLMTKSNLVGCSTGIWPGFAPRRILST